jgi:DNA end-binding protein Ku
LAREEIVMASTVWKGHLTFGLVSFPVRLYSAARGESISFNQLHKADGSRVKQVLYCAAEDKPIPRSEIVKGFEYEKDRYVIIEDEEVKKVAPSTAKVMEIQEFVKGEQVDPIYFETSYYMAPDEAGEKPYALLFDALKKTGYVGVAKIAMHNREHVVILRPGQNGVLMHTMYYQHEIRQVDEFRTDLSLVKEKELALATNLIEALAGEFEPAKYQDNYRENLLRMIEAKKQGEEVVATPEPQQAKVVDILEALKASLAMAKKPAASATTVEPVAEPEKPARRRARG